MRKCPINHKIKFFRKKINIVSPDETANKLSGGSFIQKYKQKTANEKISSTTCPFLIVDKFRKEAKQKRWSYTTLMTNILAERYSIDLEELENEDD